MRFVIYYISAVAAVVLGVYVLWSDYRIKHDGIIVDALVQTHVPGRSFRWIYYFQDASDKGHIGETRALRKPGDKIKVSYLANNPDISRDLADDFWSWTGTFLFLAGVAIYARGMVLARRETPHVISELSAINTKTAS